MRAAISSNVNATGLGAARLESRLPPWTPGTASIGTPDSRNLARSRSTVRTLTPSSSASAALGTGWRPAPRSSTSRCCRSTRRSVRWLSRDAAAKPGEASESTTRNYCGFPSRAWRGSPVVSIDMDHVATATESIEDFFARYTGYLTDGDIEGLVGIYNYPALAVTAMGCLAITEPQQSRDFFTQGQEFYRSREIQGVRAREIVTDVEVPGVWVGRLVLENLDGAGSPVGQERNAYQVVTAPDGNRRIAVSTPLDAYVPETEEP